MRGENNRGAGGRLFSERAFRINAPQHEIDVALVHAARKVIGRPAAFSRDVLFGGGIKHVAETEEEKKVFSYAYRLRDAARWLAHHPSEHLSYGWKDLCLEVLGPEAHARISSRHTTPSFGPGPLPLKPPTRVTTATSPDPVHSSGGAHHDPEDR